MSDTATTPESGPAVPGNGGTEPLMEVRDLVKHFPLTRGVIFQRKVGAVQAVDGISFDVRRGETLGLVGESGCGKSTTARLLLRLLKPTSGSIRFEGTEIADMARGPLTPLRRQMQMIFQDPYTSLNPRRTVGAIISEPFAIHEMHSGEGERKRAVQELMDTVGLNPEHYNRYPHEFSGGQRQRIRDLQRDLGLTLIFIAHDLSVVRHVCDRIAVMYLGKVVELADSDQLFEHPRHPYTGALLSAVPVPDPQFAHAKQRQVLGGDVPSPTNPPPACRFHTRCPKMREGHCDVEEPLLEPKERGNLAACHYPLTDQEVARRVPTAAA